jgi:hypothetical protein
MDGSWKLFQKLPLAVFSFYLLATCSCSASCLNSYTSFPGSESNSFVSISSDARSNRGYATSVIASNPTTSVVNDDIKLKPLAPQYDHRSIQRQTHYLKANHVQRLIGVSGAGLACNSGIIKDLSANSDLFRLGVRSGDQILAVS